MCTVDTSYSPACFICCHGHARRQRWITAPNDQNANAEIGYDMDTVPPRARATRYFAVTFKSSKDVTESALVHNPICRSCWT